LFLLGVAVILFSCSDDDPVPTSEGMLGTWVVTDINYKGSTTTSGFGMNIKSDFTGTGKDMDFTTTFSEDPNTVISEGSYTIVLKTTVLGQTETEEVPFDEIITDGTWSLEGKTLTVVSGGITQQATITKQSNSSLQMRIDINQTESEMDITVTTKIQAVYTFEKL